MNRYSAIQIFFVVNQDMLENFGPIENNERQFISDCIKSKFDVYSNSKCWHPVYFFNSYLDTIRKFTLIRCKVLMDLELFKAIGMRHDIFFE